MKIKYCLAIFFITSSIFSFGQNATDSTQQKDTVAKNITPKEARKEKDRLAKSLAPIDGKAIVYIVRPTIMGMAVPMRLDCDSFQVGWINARTYLYTILDPGEHSFKALSENEFHLKVVLEPGKIYYMEQQVKMGIMFARTKLKMLDDEKGKKYLEKLMISKQNKYPLFPLSKDVEKSPPHDD
jgi:hypothetical protein